MHLLRTFICATALLVAVFCNSSARSLSISKTSKSLEDEDLSLAKPHALRKDDGLRNGALHDAQKHDKEEDDLRTGSSQKSDSGEEEKTKVDKSQNIIADSNGKEEQKELEQERKDEENIIHDVVKKERSKYKDLEIEDADDVPDLDKNEGGANFDESIDLKSDKRSKADQPEEGEAHEELAKQEDPEIGMANNENMEPRMTEEDDLKGERKGNPKDFEEGNEEMTEKPKTEVPTHHVDLTTPTSPNVEVTTPASSHMGLTTPANDEEQEERDLKMSQDKSGNVEMDAPKKDMERENVEITEEPKIKTEMQLQHSTGRVRQHEVTPSTSSHEQEHAYSTPVPTHEIHSPTSSREDVHSTPVRTDEHVANTPTSSHEHVRSTPAPTHEHEVHTPTSSSEHVHSTPVPTHEHVGTESILDQQKIKEEEDLEATAKKEEDHELKKNKMEDEEAAEVGDKETTEGPKTEMTTELVEPTTPRQTTDALTSTVRASADEDDDLGVIPQHEVADKGKEKFDPKETDAETGDEEPTSTRKPHHHHHRETTARFTNEPDRVTEKRTREKTPRPTTHRVRHTTEKTREQTTQKLTTKYTTEKIHEQTHRVRLTTEKTREQITQKPMTEYTTEKIHEQTTEPTTGRARKTEHEIKTARMSTSGPFADHRDLELLDELEKRWKRKQSLAERGVDRRPRMTEDNELEKILRDNEIE